MDASHFVHQPFLGYLYSLEVRYIRASAVRKRYNVLGALNSQSKELITVSNSDYIKTESVCQLIDKISSKESDLPNYLIMDNARYQRNKYVMEYAKKLNIELVFLPPYSPNLNLIERVWRLIKKIVLFNKYYAIFINFVEAINKCIASLNGEYKEQMNYLLTLNFQNNKSVKIIP